MPNPRITQIIRELPFEKKIVGLGALFMIVGLFFPWYQDLDSFRTGDTFIGLSGPMYFVGFTLLIAASLSLAVLVMDYLDRKIPMFKVKTAKFHFWAGIASFYLLFVEGSVYFHPAFGVNITVKQSGFGMFMAYAAAALLTVGGYLEGRGKSAVKEFEKETREEVVAAPMVERPARAIVEQNKPREILRNIHTPAPYSGNRGSGMRHPSHDLRVAQDIRPAARVEQPEMDLESSIAPRAEEVVAAHSTSTMPAPSSSISDADNGSVNSDRKSQPYRMDL